MAWSLAQPDLLFSHNDGGHEAALFVLDLQGSLLAEIPLPSARNGDWEDLAVGPCEAGSCIYIADTGDNQEVRDSVLLYRVVDTGVYDGSPLAVEAFPMTLPEGPRDMEALFLLPGEEVFLVSKGRNHPVTVYRYPPPLRKGRNVVLETVQTLTGGPLPIPGQVTGADASPDGTVVAVRSYEALTFYSWDGNRLFPIRGGRVNLRTLSEPQGEAVGLGPAGELVLTSEAAFGRRASLTFLTCQPWDGFR